MNDTTITIDDVRAILVNAVATEAAVPPETLPTDQTFTSFGLDSVAALSVSVEIEDSLGLSDLPMNLLWDYPTVDDLAEALWQLKNTEPAVSAMEDM